MTGAGSRLQQRRSLKDSVPRQDFFPIPKSLGTFSTCFHIGSALHMVWPCKAYGQIYSLAAWVEDGITKYTAVPWRRWSRKARRRWANIGIWTGDGNGCSEEQFNSNGDPWWSVIRDQISVAPLAQMMCLWWFHLKFNHFLWCRCTSKISTRQIHDESILVWGWNLLLICRHETISRLNPFQSLQEIRETRQTSRMELTGERHGYISFFHFSSCFVVFCVVCMFLQYFVCVCRSYCFRMHVGSVSGPCPSCAPNCASGYSISKSKAFCCESGSLSWRCFWRVLIVFCCLLSSLDILRSFLTQSGPVPHRMVSVGDGSHRLRGDPVSY